MAVIPKQLKVLAQEGFTDPALGLVSCALLVSGDKSPGPQVSFLPLTSIWGNDAQGCLFWVTEELFRVCGGLSGGLGVTGATLQTAGLAPLAL